MTVSKVQEAKRLYDLGFGVHWLRPNDKIPVKPGWTSDERDPYGLLKQDYVKGYNIGTKLGKPSHVGLGYLAVIDVDVKGSEKRHRKNAEAWVRENLPGLLDEAPITLSGRGNGSMHIWLLTEEPLESRKLFASNEEVEVYMPSAKSTTRQLEVLGKKKVQEGWRLRPAFEIDFMSKGRQVVLPPSTHPDTGKEYRWKRPITSTDDLQVVDVEKLIEALPAKKSVGRPKGGTVTTKHEIVDVDESVLDMRLEPKVLAGIYEGEGVNDRSAFCLTIALSMVRARFTDAEILGVLTKREFFIGDVAFEHAKTTNRYRAARWAHDYCVRKARTEADAAEVFKAEVKVYETLEEGEAKKQLKRVVTDLGQADWKRYLDRDGNDKLKPTYKNVRLILENAVGTDVFRRDVFAMRDYYGKDTPWGGTCGEMLNDDDPVLIKDWFAHKWKIEPHVNVVNEVMVSVCKANVYHPVREYLESLEWDGVPRISTWLKDYLGAEGKEPYLSAVSRKFLVAAVARVFEPGKKFDHMLILEGLQGIGKSTVGNILAGDSWFLDSLPDLTDKDAALNLQGIWVCEMGELANLRRSDVEVTKAFITRRVDKVRPPYGKRYIESRRQCVFFGTTNAEEYLKDKTGNRRFWPVKVNDVDFAALSRDRDQLWAEALFVYDMVGEKLYLEGEAKEQAGGEQEDRVTEDESDVIYSALSVWWLKLKKARKARAKEAGETLPALKFQLIELFEDFANAEDGVTVSPPLKNYRLDNFKLQQAANALRRLGLVKVKIKGRCWWREQRLVKAVNQFV